MKLLEFINEKTNDAYKFFKLVSVIFDKTTRTCTFKFLYLNEINDVDKEVLAKLIKEYLNADVDVVVKCKKAYVDEDLVRTVLYNFFVKNFASISSGFDKSNIKVTIDGEIYIKVNCSDFQYKYLSSPENKKDILDYLENFFFEETELELCNTLLEDNISEEIIDTGLLTEVYDNPNENKIKSIKIENLQPGMGDVNGAPIEIKGINSAIDYVEIAGDVMFFAEKSFETKRKDESGNPIRKTFYSFVIKDASGRMNCVYFPHKADVLKIPELIQDGMNIIVSGAVEEFNGRLSFKVKSFGYCDIVKQEEIHEEEIIVEIKKEPNENYIFVKPETHIEIMQDNLFAVAQDVGDYLRQNEVVVFDIETTGFEATKCEILEIGAVKLRDGKIVETFETLIRPKGPIPEEITELTGINYDMVKDAPLFSQVIPDFYKFCYGTTIMAYNIDFDYKFISVHSKKFGYVFDMRQIDAMYLARCFIPGLKNFKLSSVCKKLGVSLENAHRAVHDAMATAEVVIKLGPNIA